MAKPQTLEVQQKKELVSKEEKTVPARYFVPPADIYETAEALTVVRQLWTETEPFDFDGAHIRLWSSRRHGHAQGYSGKIHVRSGRDPVRGDQLTKALPGEDHHVSSYAEKGQISRYAVPSRVLVVAAIPKTSVGKIDKKRLREQYGNS